MVWMDQKIQALVYLEALRESNEWAQEWYESSEVAANLAIAYKQDLVSDLTEKGQQLIETAYELAHQSLDLSEEDFMDLLEDGALES